ncbi:MAG: LamG-like jellyroll fold domain-containing protein [Myxococcota bacterium]
MALTQLSHPGRAIPLLMLVAAALGGPTVRAEARAAVVPGLLFHASFDTGVRAEYARGSDLPGLAERRNPLRNGPTGHSVPGVFGNGMTHVEGSFDALGNFMPTRGTLCFFVRPPDAPYGFDPIRILTTDAYYWDSYLRVSYAGQRLAAWVANEAFRIRKTQAPPTRRLRPGTWTHIALIWDQAWGLELYVNGEKVASSWGEQSWISRGVDPAEIRLAWDQGVAYDELYIFDRPLPPEQIRRLYRRNQAPSAEELPVDHFDERRRANRLSEFGWDRKDPWRPRLDLAAQEPDGLVVRQVLPDQTRALLKDATEVIDGRLGQGWPMRFSYEFQNGNVLGIRAPEPFDRLRLEGRFRGELYVGRPLATTGSGSPLWQPRPTGFVRYWRPSRSVSGWFQFRWGPPGERSRSRIVELALLKLNSVAPVAHRTQKVFLTPAARKELPPDVRVRLHSLFDPADRESLSAQEFPEIKSVSTRLAGLRYRHLLIPSRSGSWGLTGLVLHLRLRGQNEKNAVHFELRDPLLPGRRLFAIDLDLASSDGSRLLELVLDLADRWLPAGRPLWICFVFREDVELALGGPDGGSWLELLEAEYDEVSREFLPAELGFVKSRFRSLSEPRPWGWFEAPERELTAFNRRATLLFRPLQTLWKLAPEDPRVRAIWYWTHKRIKDKRLIEPTRVAGHPAAPRWALLQRELFGWCRRVLYWWIENRQAPNGEFGDGWGDDTDLMQNFPALVLLGDPGGRLHRSARILAEGVHRSGRMKDGINVRPMGPLHAYEEGINAQTAMALIEHGNPLYLERLMQAVRSTRSRYMTPDARGRLRFRSGYFGHDELRERGDWAYDSLDHAVLLHPALLLARYNRNPRALHLVTSWLDGWLRDLRSPDRHGSHPPGKPFPVRIHQDGRVLRWSRHARGFGFVSAVNGLYALTGMERYRQAAGLWVHKDDPRHFLSGGRWDLAALDLIDRNRHRDALIRWAESADLDRPSQDDLGTRARQRYLAWELVGDRAAAEEALEACIRKMRLTYEAFTWAEPIADRIWLPIAPLLMMMQGEISHERNQLWPRHHVSYSGFSDLSAWVLDHSPAGLRIWLYSFASKPEEGALHFWRVPPGRYRVRVGPDTDADGHPDAAQEREVRLLPGKRLSQSLLPGRLIALEIRLLAKTQDDYWKRPDLAVSVDTSRREGGRLSLRVHNLGSSTARGIRVHLIKANGERLAEKRLDEIAAPLELVPQVRTLVFTDIPDESITVLIDPNDEIPELNEDNNTAEFSP